MDDPSASTEAGGLDRLPAVRARVEHRFASDLERVREYLRMPSVSATGEGVREVAAATAGWIQDAGGSAELVETGGNPLILGEFPGPPGALRLVRYGMYDVQPAEEPDWTSPPFAAEIRDLPGIGPSVVARGSSNSKGALAGLMLAADVLRETGGVPVTVALMIEGEEELGSPNLGAAVRAHRDDLTAEAAWDMDLTAGPDGRPELILGCKGLLSLELSVTAGEWGGPEIPLHSSEEAWISSPTWALVQALASLTDADERILVDGLDRGALPPSPEEEALLEQLAASFDLGAHLAEVRCARYRIDGTPLEMLRALIYRPTMNISGLVSGYTGPGAKTIIPSDARAIMDVRLVPDMDETAVVQAVRRHLDSAGFGHVACRMLDHYPWAKAPAGNPSARALEAVYAAVGKKALPYPMTPWCAPYYVFDRILGLPWVSGGLGHAAGAHGPDEYATVQGLKEHVIGVAAFLLAYPSVSHGGPVGSGSGA